MKDFILRLKLACQIIMYRDVEVVIVHRDPETGRFQ